MIATAKYQLIIKKVEVAERTISGDVLYVEVTASTVGTMGATITYLTREIPKVGDKITIELAQEVDK